MPKKYRAEDSALLSTATAVKPIREAENLYGSMEMTGGCVFLKPDSGEYVALNFNALTADFAPLPAPESPL